MGSTSRWVAYLRSHFNGKSRTFLPQMEKVRCFESSIRVSGVSMNKIQCSKRESLSSDHLIPNQNSCQVQTFYVLMWVLMSCVFLEPPQKKCEILIPRNMSCWNSPRLRWGSGQGHWEAPSGAPGGCHNDDIDNFVLEKKKSDGFCVEFEFGYFGYFGQVPKNPDVFCTKLYFW